MSRPVSEIGESALLALIAQRFGHAGGFEVGPGDDTAVVRSPGPTLLYTTDALVEGVDFRLTYTGGRDLGWKAMAVNASDIASMGGRPVHALATLLLAPTTESSFVDELLDGLEEAGREWGIDLVGGDISRATETAVSIAMVGVPAGAPVLRTGAEAGDAVCVTGALGGAAGGLYLLGRGTPERSVALCTRQARPRARVEEGVLLAGVGVHSMIDVSDGLLLDLARLLKGQGLGCDIRPGLVPVDAELDALSGDPSAPDRLTLALAGGEDFELLFTMPQGEVPRARAALAGIGTNVSAIGSVTEGPLTVGGRPMEEWGEGGWDHLKDR